MDEYLKKALAIILRGMEAQVNCGIQAMHMQALKGRVPNNQSQYFMQNTNNNLLSMAMGAPNLINGVVPQQQNGQMDQVAQLIQLAKELKVLKLLQHLFLNRLYWGINVPLYLIYY